MSRWLFAGGLVLFLAAGTGCDKEEDGYALRFSHALHVSDNEMECSDCHGDLEAGRFVLPSHDVCVNCHDDVIETEDINEETCGVCHQAGNLEELSQMEVPESATMPGGAFVHTEALEKRCTDCHSPLMAEDLEAVPEMRHDDVVKIRNQAHRWDLDCSACHVDMAVDTPPASHDATWVRSHGSWGEQPDNACSMCHAEQSCQECHQEMMPQSHNNLWRLQVHGREAAWDRERCLVCHDPDSCNACHAEVQPRSHNAAWERNHCTQCHLDSSAGTGCALCHEGGLDAHPNPHPGNWENNHCRTCHSGSPEAQQCAACHGPLPLPEHLNPHPASWERNHCTQCHNRPSLDGVACASCHEGAGALTEHPNPHDTAWLNRHCTSCHEGQGQVNGVTCRECHGGDLIGNHPNPHPSTFERTHCTSCHEGATVNGTRCEVCHGPDLIGSHPNPHPATYERTHCNTCHEGATLNGTRCEVCHGGDLIGNHPNPHPANFERTHCNSCHPGSQSQNECAVCHEGAGSVLVHEDFWPPVHDRFGEGFDCFICHF